jgi:hypothetical protein
MTWLRSARSRFLARGLAAVLAVIVGGGALNWGHIGGDDPDCDPVLVLHDHNAHRFGTSAAHSPQPVEHCYLCHSLRLLHTMVVARGARAAVTVQSTLFRQFEGVVAFSAFGTARSSRAPPAFS